MQKITKFILKIVLYTIALFIVYIAYLCIFLNALSFVVNDSKHELSTDIDTVSLNKINELLNNCFITDLVKQFVEKKKALFFN